MKYKMHFEETWMSDSFFVEADSPEEAKQKAYDVWSDICASTKHPVDDEMVIEEEFE